MLWVSCWAVYSECPSPCLACCAPIFVCVLDTFFHLKYFMGHLSLYWLANRYQYGLTWFNRRPSWCPWCQSSAAADVGLKRPFFPTCHPSCRAVFKLGDGPCPHALCGFGAAFLFDPEPLAAVKGPPSCLADISFR